ncbi:hypothetical protein ACFONL_19115 [Camelimonas fluminis]|uniref:Uncharacterized protein n=1 Tax=Camelimonas fluminis TaxID=1576911 RepID=A0ABV7ULT4_9HYPH|nr:hypothetical protein [Camelimonas fluminis]
MYGAVTKQASPSKRMSTCRRQQLDQNSLKQSAPEPSPGQVDRQRFKCAVN